MQLLRRHALPLLLVASYIAAIVVPWPGQAMQGWRWGASLAPSSAQLLVAIILFAAALTIDLPRLRAVGKKPLELAITLAAVWLVPSLIATLATFALPLMIDAQAATAVALGCMLVAAMPVANSATGWAHQSSADVAWSLALVVLSIVLCPWISPLLIGAATHLLPLAQSTSVAALTSELTGWRFLLWVILPTGLGLALRAAIGAKRIDAHRGYLAAAGALAIVTLNYMNAAVALPQMRGTTTWTVALVTIVISLAMCFAGHISARLLGHWMRQPRETQLAAGYALGMKHTGLALALAGAQLAEHPQLILPIILTTLVQHAVAGMVHERESQRGKITTL